MGNSLKGVSPPNTIRIETIRKRRCEHGMQITLFGRVREGTYEIMVQCGCAHCKDEYEWLAQWVPVRNAA